MCHPRRNDKNETAFFHDPQGNIRTVAPPGRPGHVFNYTPVNLESSYAPPVLKSVPNSQTSTEYNLSRQASVIHRPDGTSIAFSYDTAGRLATVTYPGPDAVGALSSTRTYSTTSGQLVGLTTSEGEGLGFGYDGPLATSVVATGTVSGTISVAYNNDMRPTAETVLGDTVSITHDADGEVTQMGALGITRDATNGIVTGTNIGNLTQSLQHNSFGELAADETKFGTTSLFKEQLTRDATGRIESKTEAVAGVVSNYAYAYDAAGIAVECFGYGWPNGPVDAIRMRSIMRDSRLSLNFSEGGGGAGRQIKARVFEVPGAGGLLVTESAPHLERYFEPGREIAEFGDDRQLIDLVRGLLDDPVRRDAMACAGHARVQREHTYEHRLAALLDALTSLPASQERRDVDWGRFELAVRQHCCTAWLRALRAILVGVASLIWGRSRGPRAARRVLFELCWRVSGRRTYTSAGLPGRLFYRES